MSVDLAYNAVHVSARTMSGTSNGIARRRPGAAALYFRSHHQPAPRRSAQAIKGAATTGVITSPGCKLPEQPLVLVALMVDRSTPTPTPVMNPDAHTDPGCHPYAEPDSYTDTYSQPEHTYYDPKQTQTTETQRQLPHSRTKRRTSCGGPTSCSPTTGH